MSNKPSDTPEFTPIEPESQAGVPVPLPEHKQSETHKVASKYHLAPRKFMQFLEATNHPMYLFDSRSRIRFANKALSDVLGVPLEDLIGLDCTRRGFSDHHQHGKVASMLSLPIEATRDRIVCVPLTFKANSDLINPKCVPKSSNHWTGILTIPLATSGMANVRSDSKPRDKHKGVLCVWINDTSGMVDASLQSPAWYESQDIQASLLKARELGSQLGDLVSMVGTSILARSLVSQVQSAIATNVNCFIHGPIGCEQQRVALAIFDQRRQREGRSMAQVYTMPIECRLMDRMLITEMLDMAASRVVPHSSRTSGSSTTIPPLTHVTKGNDEVQVNILLEGIDNLSVDALEPIARLLDQFPHLSVIATSQRKNWFSTTEEKNLPNGSTVAIIQAGIEVVSIQIPPLSDRLEDIPAMTEQFLEHLCRASLTKETRMASPTLRRWLQSYSWPGNYDEFKSALSFAFTNSKESQIEPHDLPLAIRTFASHDLQATATPDLALDKALEDFERKILIRALAAHQNNRAAASRSLGISRPRLLRRLEQLNIDSLTNTSDEKESQTHTNLNESVPNESVRIDPGVGEVVTRDEKDSKPTIAADARDIQDPDIPIFESIED